MRTFATLVALVLCATRFGSAQGPIDTPDSERPLPTPYYVRGGRFGLPIQIAETPFRIVTIQMFVSVDQGTTWKLHGEQPPTAREFVFQAPRDGEYCFGSKTVDDRNTTRPSGDPRIEQRIIVDTREPIVEFFAEAEKTGDVQLRWRVADPNLQARSARLEYRVGASLEWKPVIAELPNVATTAGSIAGRHAWRPQEPSRAIDVRLDVSDLAGNKAVATRRVFLPKSLSAGGSPDVSGEPPGGDGTESISRGGQASAPSGSGHASRDPNPRPPGAPDTGSRGDAASGPRTDVGPGKTVSAETPRGASSGADLPDGRLSANRDASNDATFEPWPTIPAGGVLRATTSKRFQLEYDLDSAGPENVTEVQLWGTQDGGRTWEKWDKDADRASPFDVEVDREGVYGFRVVIVASNGMSGEIPRSGDPADLWVGVDSRSPEGEITGIQYGTGPRAGQLDIRWKVRDHRLSDRPIGLSFSADVGGPWTPIASGLPDTGQYYWHVGTSVPPRVYLRLEMRDVAGNEGTHTTHEAINVEGLVPKARIRNLKVK